MTGLIEKIRHVSNRWQNIVRKEVIVDESLEQLANWHSNQQVKLILHGHQLLMTVLQQIADAKQSIHWHVMLFHPDEIGQVIGDALADAARRGVKVTISFNRQQSIAGSIIDPHSNEKRKKYKIAIETLLKNWQEAGVNFRDSTLIVNLPDSLQKPAWIQALTTPLLTKRSNHYDHRKVFIVDNHIALISGANIGQEYYYRYEPDSDGDMLVAAQKRATHDEPEAWEKWFDAGLLITGDVVTDIYQDARRHWQRIGGNMPEQDPMIDSAPVFDDASIVNMCYLPQMPSEATLFHAVLAAISQAKKHIQVVIPYITNAQMMQALIAATKRGVRVRMIYTRRYNDLPVTTRVFETLIDDLLTAGVDIYACDKRMIHAKMALIDDQILFVGSFNWNYRSSYHDIEVGVCVDSEVLGKEFNNRVWIPYSEISQLIVREARRGKQRGIGWIKYVT